MTNKEAITMLERLKNRINFEVTDSQKKMDALNMAIQALQGIEDAISEIQSKAKVRLGTKKYIGLAEVENIISKYTGVSND